MKNLKIVLLIILAAPAMFAQVTELSNATAQNIEQGSAATVIIDENTPAIFEIKGKVFKIVDGDTPYFSTPVRLLYIDCHETKDNDRAKWQAEQEGITLEEVIAKGLKEKEYVENVIKSHKGDVWFILKGQDKYGRMLGEMYFNKGEKSLNQELLDNGICPAYRQRT